MGGLLVMVRVIQPADRRERGAGVRARRAAIAAAGAVGTLAGLAGQLRNVAVGIHLPSAAGAGIRGVVRHRIRTSSPHLFYTRPVK